MEAEIGIAVSAANVLQRTQWCRVAAVCVVLFDHAITFRQEFNLIWKRSWTLMTCLFLLTRYAGGIILIVTTYEFTSTSFSETVSNHYFVFDGHGSLFIVWCAQAIMQLRIYAMSQKSKIILAVMLCSFIAEITGNLVILEQYYFNGSGTATMVPISIFPTFRICTGTKTDENFRNLYIPNLCFESLLVLLSLYTGLKDAARTREYSGRWKMGPTMRMLILYNLLYFIAVLVVAVGSMGVPAEYLYILIGFSLAMAMILATRLVLAIRSPHTFSSHRLLDSEGTQLSTVNRSFSTRPRLGSPEEGQYVVDDEGAYHPSQVIVIGH
ncbi:hypothetical protein BJ138DRAFT_6295 [Hygrophoropsis aurantiaca]|uniref:Uncharacterized protein n=1 Tax=Hygrophoropsis aurantiaca TaxID=72124 RepID=A0ACB8ATA3_9AGAM|nr:hypothetical protein BJ138DRAFT_6295 [Hygrophoropsis aurantiaca]